MKLIFLDTCIHCRNPPAKTFLFWDCSQPVASLWVWDSYPSVGLAKQPRRSGVPLQSAAKSAVTCNLMLKPTWEAAKAILFFLYKALQGSG